MKSYLIWNDSLISFKQKLLIMTVMATDYENDDDDDDDDDNEDDITNKYFVD